MCDFPSLPVGTAAIAGLVSNRNTYPYYNYPANMSTTVGSYNFVDLAIGYGL